MAWEESANFFILCLHVCGNKLDISNVKQEWLTRIWFWSIIALFFMVWIEILDCSFHRKLAPILSHFENKGSLYQMDILLLLSTTYSYRISQSQKTEAVMLQPPYPPIKIAKNSAFCKVSKLLNSLHVKSQLFLPRFTIQAGTRLDILCWISCNFRMKSMRIVSFAPLSTGICPWYNPGLDLLSFELWVVKT